MKSVDVALVGLAVLSISSSAVLVRYAAASSVALAFWRCLGGAVALTPAALQTGRWRDEVRASTNRILIAGLALGGHFATWLASLELTSTAASISIVSTAPIFVVCFGWLGGQRPSRPTMFAVVLCVTGVSLFTGWSFGARSLAGDGLALAGAVLMAIYLFVGDQLRSTMSTASYAAAVYWTAALTMVPVAVAMNRSLVGFDTTTWLAIVAMVVGPQLGGHTVLNFLLGRIGSVMVSLALVSEAVIASFLTWVVFGEIPPVIAAVATPLVIAGLALALLERTAIREPHAAAGRE